MAAKSKNNKSRRSENIVSNLETSLDSYHKTLEAFGGLPGDVEIDDIDLTQNSRKIEHDESLDSLIDSIKEQGLIQRPVIAYHPTGQKKFVCVAGHRRIEAMKTIGYEEIPCLLLEETSPDKIELARLAENVVRENLKPLELAESILRLKTQLSETTTGIARTLSKNRTYVTELLKIAMWPEEAKKLVRENDLTLKSLTQIAKRKLSDDQVLEELQSLSKQKVSDRPTLSKPKRTRSGGVSAQKAKKMFKVQTLLEEYSEDQKDLVLGILDKSGLIRAVDWKKLSDGPTL